MTSYNPLKMINIYTTRTSDSACPGTWRRQSFGARPVGVLSRWHGFDGGGYKRWISKVGNWIFLLISLSRQQICFWWNLLGGWESWKESMSGVQTCQFCYGHLIRQGVSWHWRRMARALHDSLSCWLNGSSVQCVTAVAIVLLCKHVIHKYYWNHFKYEIIVHPIIPAQSHYCTLYCIIDMLKVYIMDSCIFCFIIYSSL